MRFPVLSSKAVSRQICDKQHQPPLVNYMARARFRSRQWEIQNSMFRTPGSLFFFSDVLRAQNMVRVFEGKII